MRILLTGHRGYIGAVAAPILEAAGHEIIGLDIGLFRGCEFGSPATGFAEVHKDLRDITAEDLNGFDAVVHLAALSNDPLGDLSPQLTYDINHLASVQLARCAKEAGVRRFIFASSCSTYGAAGDDFLDESAATGPVTPYAESKVYVERDIAALADNDFSPVFMRNATAYGVSPFLRLDIVLNNLVAWAYATGRIFIKSDGTPWRPIVHIEDIIHAMACALAASRDLIHNQTFNVGCTQENYRVSELAEIVAETVPGSRIEYAPDGGPDKRCYRVDFSKIEKTLNFRTRWNARTGAKQLYDAFQTNGITEADLTGPRYIRLARIREHLASGTLDAQLRWQDSAVAVNA